MSLFILFAALFQDDIEYREFLRGTDENRSALLRATRLVIECSADDAEIREVCDAVDCFVRWGKDGLDSLRRALSHDSRDVRRNAACAVALQGLREGLEHLTVDTGEDWTRRVRIAEALLRVDREAGRRLLEPLLEGAARARARAVELLADRETAIRFLADPSSRVFAAALRVLGAEGLSRAEALRRFAPGGASSPSAVGEGRVDRALERLASDSIAERAEAARVLESLGESVEARLETARDAAGDAEVRARIESALRAIRDRDAVPVRLEHVESRRHVDVFLLRNRSGREVYFYGYSDDSPLYGAEEFDPDRKRWVTAPEGWCGTGVRQWAVADGADRLFDASNRTWARWRLVLHLESDGRRIDVSSPPLNPSRR